MKQILKIQLEHTIRQLNSLSILMKVIAIFSEYYIRSYFIRSVGVTISSVSQLHHRKSLLSGHVICLFTQNPIKYQLNTLSESVQVKIIEFFKMNFDLTNAFKGVFSFRRLTRLIN